MLNQLIFDIMPCLEFKNNTRFLDTLLLRLVLLN